jgi:uncharacterized protein (DUF2237 family)
MRSATGSNPSETTSHWIEPDSIDLPPREKLPEDETLMPALPKNVLGSELQCCCTKPRTGYFRDGFCRTGAGDVGLHTVCARVTAEFLEFSVERGNDLVTPHPEWDFPGLRPGDKWCLCVERWKEALGEGVAPPVVLEATHISALEFVSLEELRSHAVKAI